MSSWTCFLKNFRNLSMRALLEMKFSKFMLQFCLTWTIFTGPWLPGCSIYYSFSFMVTSSIALSSLNIYCRLILSIEPIINWSFFTIVLLPSSVSEIFRWFALTIPCKSFFSIWPFWQHPYCSISFGESIPTYFQLKRSFWHCFWIWVKITGRRAIKLVGHRPSV